MNTTIILVIASALFVAALAMLVYVLLEMRRLRGEVKDAVRNVECVESSIRNSVEADVDKRMEDADERYFARGLHDKGLLCLMMGESFYAEGHVVLAVKSLVEALNSFGTAVSVAGDIWLNGDADRAAGLLVEISDSGKCGSERVFSEDDVLIYEGMIPIVVGGDEWAKIWPMIKSMTDKKDNADECL